MIQYGKMFVKDMYYWIATFRTLQEEQEGEAPEVPIVVLSESVHVRKVKHW